MELKKIDQIFADTAYIRTGGTAEELRCAQYLTRLRRSAPLICRGCVPTWA